jgi:hypothetical protein
VVFKQIASRPKWGEVLHWRGPLFAPRSPNHLPLSRISTSQQQGYHILGIHSQPGEMKSNLDLVDECDM